MDSASVGDALIRAVFFFVLLVSLELRIAEASPSVKTYLIAIGNNAVPAKNTESLQPLRYADDDAARFYRLYSQVADHEVLLTVLDRDSQRRFRKAAAKAVPPSLTELRRVLAKFKSLIAADRAKGMEVEFFFFFSGHGVQRPGGQAELVFIDGLMTRKILYQEILAAIPASIVHLIIDACHAEGVVSPKNPDAEVVSVTQLDIDKWAKRQTLAKFPHVGAIVATTTGRETYEWDKYRSGVFSHQLLSGLRGAADVNRDGKIEYSEVHAFVGSANSAVKDDRDRPRVLVHPPAINRRRPLIVRSRLSQSAWAIEVGASMDRFYIEDDSGTRILDAHAEARHSMTLAIPANQRLFVRTKKRQATFRARPKEKKKMTDLKWTLMDSAARGALSFSLRKGLFRTPFGPSYYKGFTNRTNDVPVQMHC